MSTPLPTATTTTTGKKEKYLSVQRNEMDETVIKTSMFKGKIENGMALVKQRDSKVQITSRDT